MIVGLGLSGQPVSGSDIGGFMSDSNPELYARWVQIGALAPFCRTHTSLHTHRQEPWSFGARTEAIARGALRLRYQLLPYLYTCFREAARTGMPPWRPLFAEFPDDPSVRLVEDQVMVGPALLAAPILEPGAVARRVVLPPGFWFDWHSAEMLEGGRTIDADAPLERMPLYVRANSALPTQPEVRFADDRPEQPLIWEIFLTREGRGEVGSLYEDDGRSFAYRHGAFRTTLVRAEDDAVRFRRRDGDYRSPRREALVRLHGTGLAPLTLDGRITSAEGLVKMPHDDEEHVLALRWGE
jgi:alpha-glucosidase